MTNPPHRAPFSHDIKVSVVSHMPGYGFTCQECGGSFEVRLSLSAYSSGEGRVCTACGSTRVERAFTAVNVIPGGSSSASLGWWDRPCISPFREDPRTGRHSARQ